MHDVCPSSRETLVAVIESFLVRSPHEGDLGVQTAACEEAQIFVGMEYSILAVAWLVLGFQKAVLHGLIGNLPGKDEVCDEGTDNGS